MKRPRSPLPLDKLLDKHRDRLPAVLLGRTIRPTVDGRYLHWDTVRRLDPPGDLNREEWWTGIKLSRRALARRIALRDARGRPFHFMLPDPVQEALHRIDSRAGGRIGMPDTVANPQTRNRFIVDSLIQEAVTSSQLEGASTTRAAAVRMLRAGRRPRDRSERMILNNYRAMRAVRDMKDAPLTAQAVLDLHVTLTADTLRDPAAAGRLQRPEDERVEVCDANEQVLHLPPPAEQLPDRLNEMVRFANRDADDGTFIHSVVRAVLLHFRLAFDHPFEDGNGRTARALFYWSMLHHDYRLFEFISISRFLKAAPAQYARAFLHVETDGNDLNLFHRASGGRDRACHRRARPVPGNPVPAGAAHRTHDRALDRLEPAPARAARPRRPAPGRRVHDPVPPDEPQHGVRHRPRRSLPARGTRAPRPAAGRPQDARLPHASRPRGPAQVAGLDCGDRFDSSGSRGPSGPSAFRRSSVIYRFHDLVQD